LNRRLSGAQGGSGSFGGGKYFYNLRTIKKLKKGKAVPLQDLSGPEGYRNFPDFMTTAQECSKVVSVTHRPHLPAGNSPGTHFC